MEQEGPFFNLKVVVRQTGLKPDTLRAWERRYGLPAPSRSSGGHRLYTQRDIDTVKWLMARQREGLSIKRAVDLWEQMQAEGRDPLETPAPTAPAPTPMLAPRAEGQTLAQLREAWMSACLAYNEQGAEQVLAEAFVMYPPEAVCLELLQESMAKIGERWYQGEVTVQQEHFCSALTIRRLEALVMASPPPIRPGRILAACPAGEEHVFGLLLLTFLLRRRGWEVIYLGASVPVDRLQTTVSAIQPQLAVLAVQQLHTVPGVIEMAEVLEREEVIMTYGGLVFNLLPDLLSRISGHFLGEDVELAVQTVEALMKAPRAASKAQPVSKEYLELRDLFVEHQNLIEAQLHRYLDGVAIAPRHIHTANRELAQNIEAALALGDIRYVGADIEWVEGLLGHHQVPMENLDRYLTAYYQAVEAELGERGGLILDWLGGLIAEGELHRRERA